MYKCILIPICLLFFQINLGFSNELNCNSGKTIILHKTNISYVSYNNGSNWVILNKQIHNNLICNNITYNRSGKVYFSNNNGLTWSEKINLKNIFTNAENQTSEKMHTETFSQIVISIFDIFGNFIKNVDKLNGQKILSKDNLNELKPGSYFILTIDGINKSTTKIVVE